MNVINSSIVAVGALLIFNSPTSSSASSIALNNPQYIQVKAENTMPTIDSKEVYFFRAKESNSSIPVVVEEKKTWIEEALTLFPGTRGLTKEEARAYSKVLDELYEDAGRNLFDEL